MSTTNFAALTDEQYTVWSRDFWKEARNKSFIMSFAGTGSNSMVQRIKELRQTTDGARAVITLVNDAVGDGVVGDNTLENNEEALRQTDCVIQIDQWRHAHQSQGRMAEQRSIVMFREEARDKLSYTASRVLDEMAFLTASGVSYAYKPDGTLRVGSQLPNIAFAADVTAPSSNRHVRWDATNGIVAGDTTAVDTPDVPTWEMLVNLKATAVDRFIKPIRTEDGIELYNVFMTPGAIAKLKTDADFLAAWQHAQKRGDDNPLFKGTAHGGKRGIYIDGLNILEYRNVFHSSTWGAGGNIRGQRCLLMGAQALAFADIDMPEWVEEYKDYKNRLGISIAKKIGLLKPVLYSTTAQSEQDFSILCCDTAY
jgi:N4-gp56 family major capsid protein